MRNQYPSITVLVPCFNTAPYLETTVQTALAQTIPPTEIILVDDGSSDGTLEIIRSLEARHACIKVVALESNQGLVAARNAGLKVSTGDYVAMLDADDLWTPDALEVRAQLAKTYPDAVVIATDFAWFEDEPHAEPTGRVGLGPRGRSLFAKSFSSGEPSYLADPFPSVASTHFAWVGATLVKRSAISAVGNFDVTFNGAEDTLLWLRLAQRGPFVFSPRITAHYRQRAGSIVAQLKGPKELHYLKVLKVLESDPMFDSRRAELAELSAESHHITSVHYQKSEDYGKAMTHAAKAARLQPRNLKYWRNLLSSGKQAVFG